MTLGKYVMFRMSSSTHTSTSERWQLTGVLALPLLLLGCATRPPQVLTPKILPEVFTVGAAATAPVWPQADWWQPFGSPELSDLITEARAGNLDLAAAAARVTEARAQRGIQSSALFPHIDAQAQAQHIAPSSLGSSNGCSSVCNSFGLSAGASYIVDLRGVVRSNVRAASESLKSARFAQQAVALTITANVANTYFNVLALRRRTDIANENIDAINGILDVIKLRVSAGTSSHLDLAQEEAQLEAVAASRSLLKQAEHAARVELAVLLGRPPERFEVQAQNLNGLVPPPVGPGLPSDLLLRRPDIAQAEADLASAHANLDAARSAFLPQFALTADGGFTSTAIGILLRSPSFAWDYGGTLVQTLFDGGQLVHQKSLATATQEELVAKYRSAVINAYADVENALDEVATNSEAENHLKREVEAAREAFAIAQLQYRQGATSLLNVLQAQQTLFSAEDELTQLNLAHLQASVHLFEALGGGWMEDPRERTQFTKAIRDTR